MSDLPSTGDQVYAIAISNLVTAIAAMFLESGKEPASRFLTNFDTLNAGVIGEGVFLDVIRESTERLHATIAQLPDDRI
jgi:hypothetical protein